MIAELPECSVEKLCEPARNMAEGDSGLSDLPVKLCMQTAFQEKCLLKAQT